MKFLLNLLNHLLRCLDRGEEDVKVEVDLAARVFYLNVLVIRNGTLRKHGTPCMVFPERTVNVSKSKS